MSGQRRDCQCKLARHTHGTLGGYNSDGCRCFPCRLAKSRYRAGQTEYGSSTYVDGIGAARRLQALALNGYSPVELAPLLDVSSRAIHQWRQHAWAVISPATHERIAAVYDQLWDQQSTNRYRLRVIRTAQRNGWLPPLAWDDDTIDDPTIEVSIYPIAQHYTPDFIDEIKVERAMHGEPMRLTRAEKSQSIERLIRMGYSDREIGERLRTSKDGVLKHRHRNGIVGQKCTREQGKVA